MDSEFNQAAMVRCKYHPNKPISFLYCKKECPHQSRLACNLCVLNYKSSEGFEDLQEVLKEPRLLLKFRGSQDYMYKMLTEYFDLSDQDPYKWFQYFKKSVLELISQMEQEIQKQLGKYNNYRAEIDRISKELNIALGQVQLQQAFKNILKVKDYHVDPEWNQLEQTVLKFFEQFDDLNNEQFKIANQKIFDAKGNFFQSNELREFQRDLNKNLEMFNLQIVNLNMKSQLEYSNLCDPLYLIELIQRIRKNKNVQPKVTLLFKGSIHGLNGKAFWEKCSNKGPTIVICKSKSGYVFGGYTPLKWVPSTIGAYHKDESKTSFVFSYTRKEIYPITTGEYAIYCSTSYGPIFGNAHYIEIELNFQDGSSNMNGQNYSNESYKIENPKTHLMGGMKPELVEMEVFLVE